MAETLLLHIDGKDAPARDGATFEVRNPATGDHLYDVAHATAEDVDAAVSAARAAFDDRRWCGIRPRDRARVLNRAADLLADRITEYARLETLQIGRPIREMRAQLARLPEWLEYFGAVAQSAEGGVPDFGPGYLNVVHRVPLGVAGLITPWNHPLLITMKKLSAALAAGNSLVIKPSELGPAVPAAPGGAARRGRSPGRAWSIRRPDSAGPPAASCPSTGAWPSSTSPGAPRPAASSPRTPGDHSSRSPPNSAARPRSSSSTTRTSTQAVAGAMFASFIATGQTCVQGARLIVQRSIYEPFVDHLAERTRSLRLGDPLEADTQIGPLVSRPQRDKVASAVDTARAQGGTVLCGGQIPVGPAYERGWFYEPTIVAGVTPEHDLWYEEVFGPVTLVVPFEDEADAVAKANDCPFGLASSVWTADIGRAVRVTERLDVGITWINDHHRIDPSSPWGGSKDSGIGSENGLDAYRGYTRPKSVIINATSQPFDWYATAEDLRYS